MREAELDAMARGEIDPTPNTPINLNRKTRRALAAERRRENRRVERLLARMQWPRQSTTKTADAPQSLPNVSGSTKGALGRIDTDKDENAV